MVEFLVLREVRREFSRTATLDFQKAEFGLFKRLVESPLGSSLEGQKSPRTLDMPQEGTGHTLNVQELVVPMCRKMNCTGRRLAWLNRELWLGLGVKRRKK